MDIKLRQHTFISSLTVSDLPTLAGPIRVAHWKYLRACVKDKKALSVNGVRTSLCIGP